MITFHKAAQQPKPRQRDKVPREVFSAILAGLKAISVGDFESAYNRFDTQAILAHVNAARAEYRLRLALLPIVVNRIERAARTEAKVIGGKLDTAANRAMKAESVAGASLAAAFDITNPRSQEFAGSLAGAMIRQITEESLAAVRAVLERAYRDGRTYRQVARDIRVIVGLTQRQAVAADNFGKKELERLLREHPQTDPGKLMELAFERKARYANRLHRQRAELIARTELNSANNFGQRELWNQAVETGWLGADSTQRWIVADDDRLCPICESLDGKTAQLGEAFHSEHGSFESPPAHPGCRCALGLDEAQPGVEALRRAA